MRYQLCKRIMTGLGVAVLAASAMWLPTLAQAALITFEFSGTVTSVTGSSAGGPVAVNDTLTGSYTFESTTPSLGPCGVSGTCLYNGGISSLNVTVGGYTNTGVATGPFNLITIYNDSVGFDLYQIDRNFAGPLLNGVQPSFFRFTLTDPLATMLSGTSLPATPPNLSGDANNETFIFTFLSLPGTGGNIQGSLTSLTCPGCEQAPVPVPPTVWLFGTGFALLAFWKLRGHRQDETIS